MTESIQAQPALQFLPPSYKGWVLAGVHRLLPLYLRSQCGIIEVEGENTEVLVDYYRQFQEGKIRFLMAYRHPTTSDPPSLIQYLHTQVPKVAADIAVKLKPPIFAYFLYERGIPMWAGPAAGKLLPAIGGIPIIRGRPDFAALRTLRHLYAFGKFPMAIAPEGYTNGHSELLSRLELGCAQTSFWCVENMIESGKNLPVWIVPLWIRYVYLENPWPNLIKLLRTMEQGCGFPPADAAALEVENKLIQQPPGSWSPTQELTPEEEAILYPRLRRLTEYLLTRIETFYLRFHHGIGIGQEKLLAEAKGPDEQIAARLQILMDAVLKMLEGYFNIQARGNLIERSHEIEETVWDWTYRKDVDIRNLSPIEHSLADRVAAEAHAQLWHLEWVEHFVNVTGHYLQNRPTARRFAETLLMFDTLVDEILNQGTPLQKIAPQKVVITVGKPIAVTERWDPSYKVDHQRFKQAVKELNQDIKAGLEAMIPATTH